jgi:hypothetical protein
MMRYSLMVRLLGPHPSDPGSSPGGGVFVPQTLFVTCISVRRTSYLLFRRDFISLRMGRELQIASGFTRMDSGWGRIGPCPEPLAYIQSAGRSHASSIGGFKKFRFSDHGDLEPTSKSSRVPATPELCERACALRREVMRGFGDHGSSGRRLLRCRHSNQTLDPCPTDMKLD